MILDERDVLRVQDVRNSFVADKLKIRQFGWATDTHEIVVRDPSGYHFVKMNINQADVDGLLDRLNGLDQDIIDINNDLGDKEDKANKKTDLTDNNDTSYPSVKAVNDAINEAIGAMDIKTDATISGDGTEENPLGVNEIGASKVTTGEFDEARIPQLPISRIDNLITELGSKLESVNTDATIDGDGTTESLLSVSQSILNDIDDKEDKSNKKTDLTDNNDTSYPSVKAVNDALLEKTDTPTKLVDQGVTYDTVRIGNKLYTVQNYRGIEGLDAEPVTDNTSWMNLSGQAGWCWHNNDSDNEEKYGKLYNWWAVKDLVLPDGWRVPTEADITELQNHLIEKGHNWDGTTTGNKIGKSMASKIGGWVFVGTSQGNVGNDQNNNNSSGFSALPSGQRNYDGIFSSTGASFHLWSATESDASVAYNCGLSYIDEYLYRNLNVKGWGMSVRLVRDVPPLPRAMTYDKSLYIENPNNDSITMFKAPFDFTFKKINAVLSGSSGGEVEFSINWNDFRDGSPIKLLDDDFYVTDYGEGTSIVLSEQQQDEYMVVEGDWVWIDCTTVQGSDLAVNISIEFSSLLA